MKKLFCIFTFLFVGSAYAQVDFGIYGGSKEFIGTYLGTKIKNTPFSLSLKTSLRTFGPIGRDYSEVMGPNAFREDIYEIVELASSTFTLGVNVDVTSRFKLGGYFGGVGMSTYYNAYDEYQILSPSGYYYTQVNSPNGWTAGIEAYFFPGETVSIMTAYDPVQGAMIGLGIEIF